MRKKQPAGGRFMTALAWRTHSSTEPLLDKLEGLCRIDGGGAGVGVGGHARRATALAAFSPSLLSGMSGQTCTYVVCSQLWHTFTKNKHSFGSRWLPLQCKACVNAAFQAARKVWLCSKVPRNTTLCQEFQHVNHTQLSISGSIQRPFHTMSNKQGRPRC